MYESSGSPEAILDQDITDRRQAASLRAQAEKCRRHARAVDDEVATTALNALAAEYEDKAAELERH